MTIYFLNTADDDFPEDEHRPLDFKLHGDGLYSYTQKNRELQFPVMPVILGGGVVAAAGGGGPNVDVGVTIGLDYANRLVEMPAPELMLPLVDIVGGDNFICVSYDETYDTARPAKNSGVNWFTRRIEGYDLECKTTLDPPVEGTGHIILARVQVIAGVPNIFYSPGATNIKGRTIPDRAGLSGVGFGAFGDVNLTGTNPTGSVGPPANPTLLFPASTLYPWVSAVFHLWAIFAAGVIIYPGALVAFSDEGFIPSLGAWIAFVTGGAGEIVYIRYNAGTGLEAYVDYAASGNTSAALHGRIVRC